MDLPFVTYNQRTRLTLVNSNYFIPDPIYNNPLSQLALFLIIMFWALIMGIVLLTLWIWYHPESVLIPLNIYLSKTDFVPRTNFYSDEDRDKLFPVGRELEQLWKEIRDEGYSLYESLPDKNINYLNNYNINLGFENKQFWTTIPLRLFGNDAPENMDKCPITSKILQNHPEIKSCLFSVMDPGKIINPHVGPYDGLLRYQLALDIPRTPEGVPYTSFEEVRLQAERSPTLNESNLTTGSGTLNDIHPGECYLHVGGEKYYWTEGKGLMFDEANIHGAVNTTKNKRMVLLIDLERPYYFLHNRLLNKGILWGLGSLPATKRATLI